MRAGGEGAGADAGFGAGNSSAGAEASAGVDASAGTGAENAVINPELCITEGELKALIREAADTALPHSFISKIKFSPEITEPCGLVTADVKITVQLGVPILAAVELVRETVFAVVAEQTGIELAAVNVIVSDVRELWAMHEDGFVAGS